MALKILNGRGLEHDQVPRAISARGTALFTTNLEGSNAGYEPLVDPGAGDDFDQWNTMITPATIYPKIHRGGHY